MYRDPYDDYQPQHPFLFSGYKDGYVCQEGRLKDHKKAFCKGKKGKKLKKCQKDLTEGGKMLSDRIKSPFGAFVFGHKFTKKELFTMHWDDVYGTLKPVTTAGLNKVDAYFADEDGEGNMKDTRSEAQQTVEWYKRVSGPGGEPFWQAMKRIEDNTEGECEFNRYISFLSAFNKELSNPKSGLHELPSKKDKKPKELMGRQYTKEQIKKSKYVRRKFIKERELAELINKYTDYGQEGPKTRAFTLKSTHKKKKRFGLV